jgi:hypothetical protein
MSLASTGYQRRWRAKKRQAEIAAGLRPAPKKAATSTERSRRYRTKLKAAATQAQAQDSTGLRQENAALRQKITVLEQELARQRAMANAAQQEGLALKALKRAMDKPCAGYEFYDNETREFHDALSRRPYPLTILWAPEEARPAIKKMWEGTLPDKDVRAALERLATDPRMRGVWQKLANVNGVAEIIPLAIEALIMFPVLRPSPQSKRREAWERYERHYRKLWMKHPHPTGGVDSLTCANWACDLRDVLARWRDVLDPTSDEANSMGSAIRFLDALFRWFLSINAKWRLDVKRYPRIVRTDDQAPQRFFARFMSEEMRWIDGLPCGPPRHDVVAVLVCVAFDVEDVETDTVEEWCRSRQ